MHPIERTAAGDLMFLAVQGSVVPEQFGAVLVMEPGRPRPLGTGSGNVTVTFAALSYAGALAVSVTADPDVMTDLDETTAALQTQLDALSEPLPAKR
ncbi:WS/DGAT domain-containing protein [Nakamurella sp. GG22]